MNEAYRVGQVLYVIPADNPTVVPVQIIERRISETTNGTVINHIIKSPKAKAPPKVLESIKGAVFADLQQARSTMVKNATMAIDAMIRQASTLAQQAFAPPKPQQQQRILEAEEDDLLGSGDVFIDEGEPEQQPIDVQEVRMLPPPPAQVIVPQGNGHSMPPDIGDADGMTEIMLPDGKTQRVRLKAR